MPFERHSMRGRKSKVKIKNLFKSAGFTYHEGSRAKPLIEVLDMQYLLDNAPIPPLGVIEEHIFCKHNKEIELKF